MGFKISRCWTRLVRSTSNCFPSDMEKLSSSQAVLAENSGKQAEILCFINMLLVYLQVSMYTSDYRIPYPLTLLTTHLPKSVFKRLTNKHVVNYWVLKLPEDAAPLTSLKYFKPQYMSLTKTQPIFSIAGSSPYEVIKACTHAWFLSGRYRTELLHSH